MANIEIEPLSPHIGAIVHGVKLADDMGNETFQQVHDALMKHQVIFFRDQEMSWDEHKAFGRKFGELHIHPTSPAPEGHPEILTIHADENSKRVAGNGWHSDVSCDTEPPMGSILHLQQVPPVGGDTMFASMYAAYNALSDKMKEILGGLQAKHEGAQNYRDKQGRTGQLRDGVDVYPEAVHPVIRTHPVTGKKGIFVNPIFTTGIVGLSKAESDAILKMLYEHIRNPEFHCRFQWKPNSVAFWDNRCVQHHALWDYYPQVRHGYRVTVAGDKPF